MLIPVSWLRDYVDIDIPPELLAERLTLAGLEVAGIRYLGVPQNEVEGIRLPKSDHLVWNREKILLGAIREVRSHPDADRLVLAIVDYGADEPEQCVTGAPNLFPYKDQGKLATPLWAPFAMEGAEVWDGHSDTPQRMTLKGRNLRGIFNKSMVCSEKELGISDEHEGILLLDHNESFVPGAPFQDILGDVILDFDLTPNLARCFSVIGIAREIAALLGKELRHPSFDYLAEGEAIEGKISIRIEEPELNPRFTLALLEGAKVKPSPHWMQHRLRLVGQRPINNLVDVTNYVTFEMGQPLHAFDYDKLVARAGGKAPTIITRLPEPGETLTTLDDVQRELDDYTILVTDTAGVLSLGGIIGGAETEIGENTVNVLLEAANWNFINIRRTMKSQKVFTEAGTRFSRGVHLSQAKPGVQRGIELMRQLGGGKVARGIVDEFPLRPEPVTVDLPLTVITRISGMQFSIQQVADILSRLQFDVTIDGDLLRVIVPEYRMDIDTGVIGQADLIEEITRIHGYDHIPDTIMEDAMPPQWVNTEFQYEEQARDLLVNLGLYENISYRFTTPEAEAMLTPPDMTSSLPDADYVKIANPISSDKTVLRHSLLISLLETASLNQRHAESQQVFEIGKVYLKYDDAFPEEPRRLGILMTGLRNQPSWNNGDSAGSIMDFYDIKGVIEQLLEGLRIREVAYDRSQHHSFHPGRSARLSIRGQEIGTFGELHPLVAQRFKLTAAPVLAAEFDLEALLTLTPDRWSITSLPITPAVLEDIALVVPKSMPATAVEAVIRKAGGDLLKDARLFDVYEGDSIQPGEKSLAYNLAYQTDEKTLTDKEVAKIRQKIITLAERELGARLRS